MSQTIFHGKILGYRRMKTQLPAHLRKYIVDQDYEKYTSVDQAVWRYCLRQLKSFLSVNGHPCYSEGLDKTGISVESIPRISEMSQKLQEFGWRALPVSGFIPPAAFMELQSLGVLPIACDMRTIDHLEYTPAPDIVHEAAGHAPIIIDKEYAAYLKEYSQVAKKAIISQEDLDLYEAIRDLSDIKEYAGSSDSDIQMAEERLQKTIKNISHTSEASQLSRMNWWTAEYGLIGDIHSPKIFGAGLLSSVGESKWCLSDKVKKIPLTIDCIKQNYDITEPQPQLFVTPDFKTLVKVLEQFSQTMAYKLGGPKALDKLLLAQSVNTIELDSGFQVSGLLEKYLTNSSDEIIFFKFSGPTQISLKEQQLDGHGADYHQHGYSSPLGAFKATSLNMNSETTFIYDSGFEIKGTLIKSIPCSEQATIYTFQNATMKYKSEIYFQPDWGLLDIVVGSKIVSAYGGAADRKNYGETKDFVAAKVPAPKYSEKQIQTFALYQKIRDARNQNKVTAEFVSSIYLQAQKQIPMEWLLYVELLELATENSFTPLTAAIEKHLQDIVANKPKLQPVINDGIKLAYAQN